MTNSKVSRYDINVSQNISCFIFTTISQKEHNNISDL